LSKTPSDEIAKPPAPTPKKGNSSHPYLHDMTLLNRREVNPSSRIDKLLVGKGADENTQAIHHHISVSDPHSIPFKGDVLPGCIRQDDTIFLLINSRHCETHKPLWIRRNTPYAWKNLGTIFHVLGDRLMLPSLTVLYPNPNQLEFFPATVFTTCKK